MSISLNVRQYQNHPALVYAGCWPISSRKNSKHDISALRLDSPGRLGSQTTLAGEYIGGRAGKWYLVSPSSKCTDAMHCSCIFDGEHRKSIHFGALQLCKAAVDEDPIGLIFSPVDEDPTKWV